MDGRRRPLFSLREYDKYRIIRGKKNCLKTMNKRIEIQGRLGPVNLVAHDHDDILINDDSGLVP